MTCPNCGADLVMRLTKARLFHVLLLECDACNKGWGVELNVKTETTRIVADGSLKGSS